MGQREEKERRSEQLSWLYLVAGPVLILAPTFAALFSGHTVWASFLWNCLSPVGTVMFAAGYLGWRMRS